MKYKLSFFILSLILILGFFLRIVNLESLSNQKKNFLFNVPQKIQAVEIIDFNDKQ